VTLGHGEAAGSPKFWRSSGLGRPATGGGWPGVHLGSIPTLSQGGGGAGEPARRSQAAAAAAAA
jgi:hypothetical protein